MAHTVWFENSHDDKLRASLQTACSSQPVIRFRPFLARKTWASDPFVLFQNSIRFEMQDLFTMIRNAAFHMDMLHISHCLALQKWVMEFGQMAALYFLVQERAIIPELIALQSRTCSISELRQKSLPLVQVLVSIHATSLRLTSACRLCEKASVVCATSEMYESLRVLSELVCGLAVDCEKLFSWELDTFVPIMKKKTRGWVRHLERRCFLEVLSVDVGEQVFGGYTAHLPAGVRAFFLKDIDAFKLRRIRAKERRWSRTHKALRTQFAVEKIA